jgi:thymidylate synthase
MKQFHDNLQFILDNGSWKTNRTQYASLMVPGLTMRFDLRQGFPAVTTKKLAFKSALGELCGFLKPVRSAVDMRALGSKVWDQNANENAQWLANPFRKGEDDLGDVYGAMWREWPGFKLVRTEDWTHEIDNKLKADGWHCEEVFEGALYSKSIDMLGDCVRTIILNPDDRRILFHAWNPAKLDEMALPPCHLLYHFLPNKDTKELALCMTQRSADYFLGIPFNIASSALLLHIVARLTGYTPTWLTITTNDSHIYENAIDATKELLTREPYPLPRLEINPEMPTFERFHEWNAEMKLMGLNQHDVGEHAVSWLAKLDPTWFTLEDYQCHDSIKVDMAV